MTTKPCLISEECLSHGYPRICVSKGKYILLARYVLEQHLGRPLLTGYEVCHTCNNTKCIEITHLYEGTHSDNMWDLKETGNTRFFGNYNKEKTHCIRGHEFNAENTTYRNNGNRRCKICGREDAIKQVQRRKQLIERLKG